jgi:hypothetical protein
MERMTIRKIRFENGYELESFSLPWGQCIEVELRNRDGEAVHPDRSGRGLLMPMAWLPELHRAVEDGEIESRGSLENFFSQMSKATGLAGGC